MKDEELSAYSAEHLMHELSMLWELAAILPGREASTETSALLESFAVHLRNLIEFFFFPVTGDYVRAAHFFDDSAAWAPTRPPEMNKLLERANNEVSHLTKNRLSGSPPEKEWDVGEMSKAIETIAKTFAQTASPKKLAPTVRNFLGLPGSQMAAWIGDNVTRSNVAVQSVTVGHATRAFSSPDPSTSTVIKLGAANKRP